MNKPIIDPLDFIEQFRAAIKINYPLDFIEELPCIIVRCPSNYGAVFSVIIEWQGSPPLWRIYVSGMDYANAPVVLVVWGKVIRDTKRANLANDLIKRFLAAHPANPDGSPVWIKSSRKKGVCRG